MKFCGGVGHVSVAW